jgi:hypothetical protein
MHKSKIGSLCCKTAFVYLLDEEKQSWKFFNGFYFFLKPRTASLPEETCRLPQLWNSRAGING